VTRHGETSPLREALAAAAAEIDCPLKALTAMASQNDPFRIDTPARHRDGEWLALAARLTTKDRTRGDRSCFCIRLASIAHR
jgi:hypothetical protein